MPRKLKTFITNLGFFELAVAAPSMKAALEAWGMSHNAFQHGLAKQTDDPKIIAATTVKPGIVLKCGVGTAGEFSNDPKLPASLPGLRPPNMEPRNAKTIEPARKSRARKTQPTRNGDPTAERAAVLSFGKSACKARTGKGRRSSAS